MTEDKKNKKDIALAEELRKNLLRRKQKSKDSAEEKAEGKTGQGKK